MAKLKGEIDIITRQAEASVARLQRKIQTLNAKIKVVQDEKIDPEIKADKIKRLNKQLNNTKVELKAINKIKVDIALGKNIEKARAQIARINFEIAKVRRAGDITPEYRESRLNSLNRQLKLANAGLDELQGKKITLPNIGRGRRAINGLKGGVSNLLGMVGGLPTVLLGVAGALGAFAVGAGNANKEIDKLTVGIDKVVQHNNILNRGMKTTSKEMVKGLQDVSKGMLGPIESQKFLNKALQLGIVESQEQLEQLTQNALILGQKMGLSLEQSLELLTEGVAKGSIEILDNAGIVITAAEAYDLYAAKLGITANQLTEVQRKEARRQAAIDEINKQAGILGGETALIVDESARLTAEWQRFMVLIGEAVDGPMAKATSWATNFVGKLADGAAAWQDITNNASTIVTAIAGTDLGLEGVDTGVERRVLEMDLTSLDEAINKNKEWLELNKDNARVSFEYNTIIEETKQLEAERVALNERLAGLQESQRIDPNVNNALAKAVELQQQQAAAADLQSKEAKERIELFKTLSQLEKQGFLSRESFVEQLHNKEQSLADLRIFTEQSVQSAKVQNHINELNRLDEVANKQAEVAQLELSLDNKRAAAQANFEKRRSQFYANESKRIAQAREEGLKGLVSGLGGQLGGELGDLFGGDQKQEGVSRKIAENARRLAAVAREGVNSESAQLLKDEGFWDKIFGAETDPAVIQAKAQALGNDFRAMMDMGLIDVEAAADLIVNQLTGGSDEQAFQDAVMAELQTRGLSPELLDKAFNITKQEFGEKLDVSMVGENEQERIKELNLEIQKLGEQGSMSLNEIGKATKDLEQPMDQHTEAVIELEKHWDSILKKLGVYQAGVGGLGLGGGEGAEGVQAPEAGPPSPTTGITTPAAIIPTSDFAPQTPTTTGNRAQTQAGGGGQGVNVTPGKVVINLDGQVIAQATTPYIARSMA
jgi:hypothetical protein